MKNSMDKFNSKMKMIEERRNLGIDQLKLFNPNNRKKEVKKNEQSLKDLRAITKMSDISYILQYSH